MRTSTIRFTTMTLRFSCAFYAIFFILIANAQTENFLPGVLELKMRQSSYANEVVAGGAASPVTPFQQIKLKYGVTSFEKISTNFPSLANYYTLKFSEIHLTEQLIADLQKLNEVILVEQVPVITLDAGAIPIDASGDNMWYLTKINISGWDYWKDFAKTGDTIKIAIVDNAVRLNHEDLRDVICRNYGEVPGNGIDDDNNGYIDDYMGFDVADMDPNANPPMHRLDLFNHGTMVAGLSSASTDNGIGIASLGLNTRIIPVKCVKDEAKSSTLVYAWEGVEYAIVAGADIINLSWSQLGLTERQKEILDLALSKGIIIVASAGNVGENIDPGVAQVPVYPAAYEGVISVGATTNEDVVWSKSRYGTFIDVMAPGVNVYTTTAESDNSYGPASGTSFSAPIVSGFLGLLLSQDRNVERVIRYLKEGCDNINKVNSDKVGLMGAGRINIDRTLELLMNGGGPDGLIDLNQNREIIVFPNPSTGIVRVAAETVIEELVVIDLSGKEVARLTVNGNTADLTAYQLKGLHIIQVKNQEGMFTARVYFQ